jgi:hypothetical protein
MYLGISMPYYIIITNFNLNYVVCKYRSKLFRKIDSRGHKFRPKFIVEMWKDYSKQNKTKSADYVCCIDDLALMALKIFLNNCPNGQFGVITCTKRAR